MKMHLTSIVLILLTSVAAAETVDCAEPPTIPYTKLEKTSTTHGSYATYVFQDPYKLIGHQRVQCLFGEWISMPRCNYEIRCKEQVSKYLIVSLTNENRVDSFARFHCSRNSTLIGSATSTCQPSGIWSHPWPVCEIRCLVDDLPFPGLLRGPKSSFRDGEVFAFKCDPKYKEANVKQFTCADGKWMGPIPPCIPELACEKPLQPERGSVQFSDGQAVGSIATYSCEEGTTLVGAPSSKCLENGVWTFDPPKCLRSCIIPDTENGVIGYHKEVQKYEQTYKEFVQFQMGETVKHGVSVIVRCQAGFILENLTTSLNGDSDDVSCNDGILSKPIQCSANITCPMINTEKSLIVVYTNDNKVNSRATFRCNGDAKLIGENSTICKPIGQWSNPIPTCESIQRCALGEISPQLLAEPIKEYYLFGDQVTFSCPRGYELSSEVRRVMCLGTSWSNPIPDCVKVY